jgi:hypothetical protein
MQGFILKNLCFTIILLISILLFSLSLNGAFAANYTISDSSSESISSGITKTGVNDTLFLAPGTYNKTGDVGISISKNITIQGNGSRNSIIIDAGGLSRIFTTGSNLNVKFINIKFINGNITANGGAIYNSNSNTKLTFINCTFINNSVTNTTTSNGYGGAIYNSGHNMSIFDCDFIENNAGTNGGAIYNSGENTTIADSRFTNNLAFYSPYYNLGGGAIFNTGRYVIVSNCNFTHNNASYGGAIYNSGVNFTVFGSIFENNLAKNTSDTTAGRGGSIVNSGHNMTVSNCHFIGNSALEGGVIYNSNGGNTGQNFTVINSSFSSNSAKSGAAIYNQGGVNFNVIGSNFTNNTAQSMGGAIKNGVVYNSEGTGVNFTVSNSNFDSNTAGYGGAIYNLDCKNFTVIGSDFKNNSAIYGGAINTGSSNEFTVLNSNFSYNNATQGGAIYNNGGVFSNGTIVPVYNVTVINCNFEYNTATYGAAIFTNRSSDFNVSKSNFTENKAKGDGGGIWSTGINTIVEDSKFMNNHADLNGGGIFNGGSMIVSNNAMDSDTASGLGNVIYNNGNMTNLNLTYLDNSTWIIINNIPVLVYATITDDMGNLISGGKISFYVGGKLIGNITVLEGFASITYNPITLGILPVEGSYSGSGLYPIDIYPGQFNVIEKFKTNSTMIVLSIVQIDQKTNISGIVNDEFGNPIVNTNITIIINEETFTKATDNSGNWALIYTPNHIGNFDVFITWEGNDTHNRFTNNTSFTVDNDIFNEFINILSFDFDDYSNPTDNDMINDTNNNTDNNYLNNNSSNIYTDIISSSDNTNDSFKTNSITNSKLFALKSSINDSDKVSSKATMKNEVSMKQTGVPAIIALLTFLSMGFVIKRKQK